MASLAGRLAVLLVVVVRLGRGAARRVRVARCGDALAAEKLRLPRQPWTSTPRRARIPPRVEPRLLAPHRRLLGCSRVGGGGVILGIGLSANGEYAVVFGLRRPCFSGGSSSRPYSPLRLHSWVAAG